MEAWGGCRKTAQTLRVGLSWRYGTASLAGRSGDG